MVLFCDEVYPLPPECIEGSHRELRESARRGDAEWTGILGVSS